MNAENSKTIRNYTFFYMGIEMYIFYIKFRVEFKYEPRMRNEDTKLGHANGSKKNPELVDLEVFFDMTMNRFTSLVISNSSTNRSKILDFLEKYSRSRLSITRNFSVQGFSLLKTSRTLLCSIRVEIHAE